MRRIRIPCPGKGVLPWVPVALFLCCVHAAGKASGVPAVPPRGAGGSALGLELGLRNLGAKRSRSPSHTLEREEAEADGTARIRLGSTGRTDSPAVVRGDADDDDDDAQTVAHVLDTETDVASELPWRTPSPANLAGGKATRDRDCSVTPWPESDAILKYLDENHDKFDRKSRADYLREDLGSSAALSRERELSEASEEAFLFHHRVPSNASVVDRAGWAKMDAQTAQALDLVGKLPVAIDRDSASFLKQV